MKRHLNSQPATPEITPTYEGDLAKDFSAPVHKPQRQDRLPRGRLVGAMKRPTLTKETPRQQPRRKGNILAIPKKLVLPL
jgi:hypothetical protein